MLNWDAIDTVLLDMDGTLLDLHFDTYFWLEHLPRRYAEHHGVDPVEAQQTLHERIIQEQGTLNWYCLDYWSTELDIDVAALKHEVSEKIGFRPHVEDFLAALRAAKIRTLIVTNAHQKSLAIKTAKTGLDQLVDRVVCSHDYKLPKESQAFWQSLQKDEPFVPARSLLIDDSLAVLRSAQEYGIGHLLTILQPDSQKPARDDIDDEFIGLDYFHRIHPVKVKPE